MQPRAVRKPTRSYVLAVAVFAAGFALALIVAAWGLIALGSGSDPLPVNTPVWLLPLALTLMLLLTMCNIWGQSVALLRQDLRLPFARLLLTALIAFGIWLIAALTAGLTAGAALANWYPLSAAIALMCSQLGAWLVLLRYIYTSRATPAWPWEKREAREAEIDKLEQLWERS